MMISIDGVDIFEITPHQKSVIQYYINSDIFDADMKRRLEWVIKEIYKESFNQMKREWDKKLESAGITSIPLDKEAYAALVFSQPNYMDRKARDLALPPIQL